MHERRLAALERRTRFLQVYAIGATVLLLVAATRPAAARFDVVAAERFVVLDENGDTRAVLGMQIERDEKHYPDGPAIPVEERYVALRLESAYGARAELIVRDGDEPELVLASPDEDELARFNCDRLAIGDESSGMRLRTEGLEFESSEEDDDGESESWEIDLSLEKGLSIETRGTGPDSDPYRRGWRFAVDFRSDDRSPRIEIVDLVTDTTRFEAP